MAALPRTRRIEEILREAQLDPRLISIICELAERQRVQHQQIYGVAQMMGKLQDFLLKIIASLKIRDGNLESLGVKEMLTNMQTQKGSAAHVESVEDFDASESDHGADQGRKN